MYWFSNTKKVVDGANDNLTACYMAMAALKTLKDEGIEFENTEVCVLLTGSEEAGLRGPKRLPMNIKTILMIAKPYLFPWKH